MHLCRVLALAALWGAVRAARVGAYGPSGRAGVPAVGRQGVDDADAAPASSPSPDATPSLGASLTPDASPTPDATPALVASPSPDETPTAVASPTPDATPAAVASPTPDATPTLAASASADATPEPDAETETAPEPVVTAVATPAATPTPDAACSLECSLTERLDAGECECVSLMACDGRMRQRREFREMPAAERAAFVSAVNAMNANGVWGQLAALHSTNFRAAHREGNFCPWHSGFLFLLESMILDLEPSVRGLPYFEWGAETDTRESTMFSSTFMGGSTTGGGPIPNGPFEDFTVDGEAVNRNFTQLTMAQTDNLTTIAAVIQNRRELPFWAGEGESDVSDSLELLHDRFHLIVGGTMLIATSPRDPIFYLHHAFVDKWWAKQWPAASGFTAASAPERMLEGLPLTRSYSSLGGFTLQNSVDIQSCVDYIETRARPPTLASTSSSGAPAMGTDDLQQIANFQKRPLAEIEAIAEAITGEVNMAMAVGAATA